MSEAILTGGRSRPFSLDMTRTVLRGCSGTSRRAKYAQLLTSMRRFSNSIMMSLRSTSSTRQFRQTAAIRMAPHIEPRSHTMCTRDSMHFTITQTQRCCRTLMKSCKVLPVNPQFKTLAKMGCSRYSDSPLYRTPRSFSTQHSGMPCNVRP